MSQEIENTATDFNAQLMHAFETKGKKKTYAKGEFIIREGEQENNLYLVIDGAVRAYFLSEHEEHTIRLGYNGSFINSLASFFSRKPSELYIEALRKTEIKSLKREDLLEIANRNEKNLMQYNSMLENLVVQQIERELDLLIDSPSERLERVLKRSPHVFNYVPLKYIASYLRMKPETLSRIRNS
ncbi:MAG TPA: Crp/Fnr family transcriptional regulator [Bacteroidia bacterium]